MIALMPMKGHSERVPRKNLRLLHGKPLCFWVLETLFAAKGITQVVINTDDEEIAETTSKRFPVKIVWRPEPLRGDFVSMNKILEHDIAQFPAEEHFLQTHSTNPLLTTRTVEAAIDLYLKNLRDKSGDSVFSVTRHQARFFDQDGRPINHDPKNLIRTQDLPPLFEENSNFYIFSRSSFQKTQARIGVSPKMIAMDVLEAVDIDEEIHWRLAEALLRPKA
jgi:CMP-N-acetylneuraminic acid synthetase